MTIRRTGIIYLFFVAIIGTIFGSVFVDFIPHAELSSVIERWGSMNPFEPSSAVESELIMAYFQYHLKLAILLFVCGLTVIGYPCVIVIHFLKAFIVGMNIKLFMTIYGDEAILYIGIWIVPVYVLSLGAYIILSDAMLRYSTIIFKNIKERQWSSPLKSIQNPMLLSLILFAIATIAHFFLSPYLHVRLLI